MILHTYTINPNISEHKKKLLTSKVSISRSELSIIDPIFTLMQKYGVGLPILFYMKCREGNVGGRYYPPTLENVL